MKTGIFKQFILLSLLFSFGLMLGMLSNPALSDLAKDQEVQKKEQPVKKVSTKKKRFA